MRPLGGPVRGGQGHSTVRQQDRDPPAAQSGQDLIGFGRRAGSASSANGPPTDGWNEQAHRAGSEKRHPVRCFHSPGMAINLSKMFITVHDPDEALGFYHDALGLEVRQDVENNGFRWVTEPTDQFWGVRDCAFRDPSGNLVRIA